MPSDEAWLQNAERLLERIHQLTEDGDRRSAELERLGADLDVARATIRQLVALNDALRIELYELKRKPEKRRVGIITTAVVSVAAGLLGGIGQGVGTEAYDEWRGLRDHAVEVAVSCEIPPSVIPGAPQTVRPQTVESQSTVGTPTISVTSDDAGTGTESAVVTPHQASASGASHSSGSADAWLGTPRLVLESGSGDALVVVNVSRAEAFEVVADAAPSSPAANSLIFTREQPLPHLSSGARWTVGTYGPSLGDQGSPVVRIGWLDANGTSYDGEFPVSS